ncbi:hypothetical protein [Chryseobacterium indoltheticum]|uniref:hypothetical protein n=1 Tax=Chryseobacterium indoltheticum TaxID=254 RepID=UPI003F49A42F
MKTIYNSIKEKVAKHSKVQASVLGSVDEWKRSHYIYSFRNYQRRISFIRGTQKRQTI